MTLEKLALVKELITIIATMTAIGIDAKVSITENALGDPEIVIRDIKEKT